MVPAPVGHQCPTCVGEARREFAAGPGRRIAIANAKRVSVTNVLVAIIVAVFVIEVFQSGVDGLLTGPSSEKLFRMGADYPPAIAAGETWRLLTSMFLHIGLIHLAVNAYSLYILGNVLEREVGRVRFLALYLLSGLFASAASYYFSPINTVSAGASGAIFGIFGAVFAINYRRRHTAQGAMAMRAMAQIIVLNVIINVVFNNYLDWRAHVGGVIAGLIMGFAFAAPGRATKQRWIAIGGCVVVALATVATVMVRTDQIRTMSELLGTLS
jgi:membrane associated rhomboid family serine protease